NKNITDSELLERLNIAYKREVELDPTRHVSVFVSLTMFMLLIFGFFGINPTWKEIKEKQAYSKELSVAKVNLRQRLDDLTKHEKQLKEAEPYLSSLDKVVPTSTDIDKYLVELAINISDDKYLLKQLYASPENVGGVITLQTKILKRDDIDNLADLVKSVEDLKRTTVVDSIKIKLGTQQNEINMSSKIYNYGGTN
ncbi:hypothetical protein KC980_02540, partial [candidate division WWE3 bacterium]|nr:hypothetical protein [candidate division WWE3 bacterium]